MGFLVCVRMCMHMTVSMRMRMLMDMIITVAVRVHMVVLIMNMFHSNSSLSGFAKETAPPHCAVSFAIEMNNVKKCDGTA